jgi:hypothetical protein
MKIVTVSLSKTIPTGAFMNDKVGMEATVEGEETAESVLSELSNRINKWHELQYKPGWTGPSDWVSSPTIDKPQTIEMREIPTIEMREIPTISKNADNHNETLELIQNAPDMEALLSFKLLANNNAILYAAYCERFKWLLEPGNFAEGLDKNE